MPMSDSNPFFNVSFLKSPGVPDLMNGAEISGFDIGALMTMHQKNIELLMAINQALFENLQSFGQRQLECMRQSLGQTAARISATPDQPIMSLPSAQNDMVHKEKNLKSNGLETTAQ